MGAAGFCGTQAIRIRYPKSKFSFDIRQPSRCPEIIIFRQNYFRVGDHPSETPKIGERRGWKCALA
jgi:hypothetical protein